MFTDNSTDIIDSRDIIQRIDELKDEFTDATITDENPDGDDPNDYSMSEDDWAFGLGTDGAREIVSLLELAEAGENFADWHYGLTLVRETYFTEYAKQLAEDCGDRPRDASWPFDHIDWERAAEALLSDYSDIDFDGVTYWCR